MDILALQLFNDRERVKIQPAFILATLALAQLLQSSSVNQGSAGMTQAMELRLQAQTALDEARHSGLLSIDLAKAQFVSGLTWKLSFVAI